MIFCNSTSWVMGKGVNPWILLNCPVFLPLAHWLQLAWIQLPIERQGIKPENGGPKNHLETPEKIHEIHACADAVDFAIRLGIV
jgi:hypothetical protein